MLSILLLAIRSGAHVKEKDKFLRISNIELRASQGLKSPRCYREFLKSFLDKHNPFYDFLYKITPEKFGITPK